MKRLLLIVIGVLFPILAVADGRQYMERCKELYKKGEYEQAKQYFEICKQFAEISKAEVNAWIEDCEKKILIRNKEKARRAAEIKLKAQKAEEERRAAMRMAEEERLSAIKAAEEARVAAEEKARADSLRRVAKLFYVSAAALTSSGDKHGFEAVVRKAVLSSGKKCTLDREKALWTIFVSALPELYKPNAPDGMNYLHVYASVLITDEMTGEILYEEETRKVKGYGETYERAVDNAYANLNVKLLECIKEVINNIL